MSKAIVRDWNVLCQICRGKIKASEAVKRWDGYIVGRNHPGCFEHRNPLDLPQPLPKEYIPLPFTSPEGTDVEIGVCTAEGRMGIAGYGVAGCATAGLTGLVFDVTGVPTGTFDTNNETL